MGDGRAEGLSAIGDGRQAAISLTPHVDGTGSGSLLDSVLSSSLKNDSVMFVYAQLSVMCKSLRPDQL